jgi:ribosome-associated protein
MSDREEQSRNGEDRDRSLGVERAAHGYSRSSDPAEEAAAQQLAIDAARSLHDDKCEDVLVLDVRGLSQMTDYLVLASGTSDVQMRAATQHVLQMAKKRGEPVLSQNVRENDPTWILADLVDVIVHVFEPDTRRYYDLEMLWGDAERVEWAPDDAGVPGGGTARRNRAGLSPGEAREQLEQSGSWEPPDDAGEDDDAV